MEQLQIEEVIRDWHRRVKTLQSLHLQEAKKYHNRHIRMGIFAIVITALSACSWLSNVSDPHMAKNILAGLATIATVIVSLQTFLDFGGAAEKHKSTASKAGSIRRLIELLLVTLPQSKEELQQKATELNALISDVSSDAPILVVSELKAAKMEQIILFSRRKANNSFQG